MNNKKIEIFCTLGPSSINSRFLKSISQKKNVSLVRLNMSHISINKLKKFIIYIRKFTNCPICIDTEGAQIRTKIKKSSYFKVNQIIKVNRSKGNFTFYPPEVFEKIRRGDILDIGFDDLKAKVIKINQKLIVCKTVSSGKLENNKGINISNRKIKLSFLTTKDLLAIKIAKQLKIKNFALSFTNNLEDVKKFNQILPNQNKIFKIESKSAINNLTSIIKNANNFLIDRGDLSKEIKIENIPSIQRKILRISKKYKNKNVFVATNFLESMILNKYPSRGEANDIFSTLEMGAKGLVLAAETAIGKHPEKTIEFLDKMISVFKKKNN
jgi:pyruvate kinase